MVIRICDRCLAPVATPPSAVAIQVAIGAPATKPNKVTDDPFAATLAVSVQPSALNQAVDLCPICYASAVVEFVVAILAGGGLSANQAKKLEARIDQAVGA